MLISALQHKSNSISNFLEKKSNFWFTCCSTRKDLSVDVSSTYVGLVLTKPGQFLFSAYGNSGYGQNSISLISNFLKKIPIFGFPCCITREDLSIVFTSTTAWTPQNLIFFKEVWNWILSVPRISVRREKKSPWLCWYKSYISNWYINGKVFTSTTTWEPKNLIIFFKKF